MTVMRWTPSPSLAQATRGALEHLARHWPRSFALLRDDSEAGAGFANDFAFALTGVSLDAIPLAAQRWVATNKHAPGPSELASMARTIANELRGTSGRQAETPTLAPPPVHTTRRGDLVQAIGREARTQLGSWSLVSEVWALLYHTAPTSEARLAVHDGTVARDIVQEAIDAIKRGARAPSGPLRHAVFNAEA